MAAGDGDLLYRLLTKAQPDYREKIWDHAAGSLIVEEAGGRVTDFEGKRWSLENFSTLVFSNGFLHDAVLNLLHET